MSNEVCMYQIVLCANAIKRAIQRDEEYFHDPYHNREDGCADWYAAAYHFGRLNNADVGLTGQQMRNLYHECISYLV